MTKIEGRVESDLLHGDALRGILFTWRLLVVNVALCRDLIITDTIMPRRSMASRFSGGSGRTLPLA